MEKYNENRNFEKYEPEDKYQDDFLDVGLTERLLEEEFLSRSQRKARPEIIEIHDIPEYDIPSFREGTISVFVGIPGSEKLKKIKEALFESDFKSLSILSNSLAHDLGRSFLPQYSHSNIATLSDLPSILDIKYKSKSLIRGIATLPSLEVAESASLWNGGKLDYEGFEYIEYLKDDKLPQSEVIIVLIHPRLSDLEKTLLKQVPPELDEVHMTTPSLAWPAVVTRITATTRTATRATPVARQVLRWVNDKITNRTTYTTLTTLVNRQQQNQQGQQQQGRFQQIQQQQQQQGQGQQQQQQQNQQQQNQQQQGQQQQQQQQQQQGQQQQQQQQQRQQQQGPMPIPEWEPWKGLDNFYKTAEGPIVFDRPRYLDKLQETDFESLDASLAARTLLRIRQDLLEQGMP